MSLVPKAFGTSSWNCVVSNVNLWHDHCVSRHPQTWFCYQFILVLLKWIEKQDCVSSTGPIAQLQVLRWTSPLSTPGYELKFVSSGLVVLMSELKSPRAAWGIIKSYLSFSLLFTCFFHCNACREHLLPLFFKVPTSGNGRQPWSFL